MFSVSMQFDPEVAVKDWLSTIMDLAEDIIADELGPLTGIETAPLLDPSMYAVGFVIDASPAAAMIQDGDEVARKIGDRIVYDFTNAMALEARIGEFRDVAPMWGFVKLEFGEGGFSAFTIDGANPGCRQGQGLNH